MMVAEKAADLTLGNQPVPPATVPFSRQQRKHPHPAGQQAVNPAEPAWGRMPCQAPTARPCTRLSGSVR
jgi:hypothetical protein